MLRILALIPARAGSQGLANKNLQRIGRRTLLAQAVTLALASRRRGEHWDVVVSTESHRYAVHARRAGAEVPFLRPARLASHRARLIDVVKHTLVTLSEAGRQYDAVLLLSATTPLTSVRDVRHALQLFRKRGQAVVSVTKEQHPDNWRFALAHGQLISLAGETRIGRRQESPPRYRLNGALYLASPAWLSENGQFVKSGRTTPLVLPKSRSLDIEDNLDLQIAKVMKLHCPTQLP